MRPGPIGPGIPDIAHGLSRRYIASMRPGPIGPGIVGAGSTRQAPVVRFNEAGANWPRNCVLRCSISRYGNMSFNEAGANWPRNYVMPSTRPRMTPCFNEAGANWPRN